jgi:hypothetical protein
MGIAHHKIGRCNIRKPNQIKNPTNTTNNPIIRNILPDKNVYQDCKRCLATRPARTYFIE